jgi:NAD kinase
MTAAMVGCEKLVLVTRKTRLAELVERFNTKAQAKFYLDHSGGDFADYEREDDAYRASLDAVRRAAEVGVKLQLVDRTLVPTTTIGEKDLVVAVGQDGLVANVAKYAGSSPIVAVNPDPARFDGVLLPFSPATTRAAIESVLAGTARRRLVTLAEVKLNDGQRLLAFNDFFLGARTHVSARYKLSLGRRSEKQSSSGLIVSTGAGSTGWLSSVFNMAAGITSFRGGQPTAPLRWEWSERKLTFVVREPFASRHSEAQLVAGLIEGEATLSVESMMPMNGVIFSDGVEADYLDFNAGAIASIGVADRQAVLIAA